MAFSDGHLSILMFCLLCDFATLQALKRDVRARFPSIKQVTVNERTRSLIIKGTNPNVPTVKQWLESKGL